MAINVNDFEREVECTYKNENYSVRDNGAIFRHARKNRSLRKYDNNWTFGVPNKDAYMLIAGEVVHRIVACAFQGDPPTPQHIVDHIDTNRQNNRPENLRWLTKFENVLQNPITVKKIETVCGCSIEEFLEDPAKYRDMFPEPNYKWMCTVSKEEAQASKQRLISWAKNDKIPFGGSLGEWIFNRSIQNQYVEKLPELIPSLTPNAVQKNWKTPSEFPLCPQEKMENHIEAYASNLKIGELFSRNQYSYSVIEAFATSADKKTLWVLCKNSDENPIKPWTMAEVTYESDSFTHTNLGSFFTKDGAVKKLTLLQGLEWTGGETVDDGA